MFVFENILQLNLPQHIAIGPNAFNTIDYIYSANGTKLQKTTSNNREHLSTTDYLGSIVYTDNTPEYIITPEGRAVPNENGAYDYEYFLKDHLGNTRVSFSQTGRVLQENKYYPFGMSMGESLTYHAPDADLANENKYLYNGKEFQNAPIAIGVGLDWYDYGARFYDAELGRFHTQDRIFDLLIRMEITPHSQF